MSSYIPVPEGKDPKVWHQAVKRASFKRHLMTYLAVNAFLWIIWAFTGARTYGSGIPWPAWSTFGWGIGLFFHYAGAYMDNGTNKTEEEYQKIMRKNQNN